jgi:hypothetical protein
VTDIFRFRPLQKSRAPRTRNALTKTDINSTFHSERLLTTYNPHLVSVKPNLFVHNSNPLQREFSRMSARSLAQEATSWYLSHLDPCAPNEDNVKTYLRGPVLALTLKVLSSPDVASAGLEIESDSVYQEEKKSAAGEQVIESPWRKFLHRSKDDNWNEQDQDAYDALGHRTKARLEAFLASCSLSLPGMSNSMGAREESKNKLPKKPTPKTEISLTEALAGYRVSKDDTTSSPTFSSTQASTVLLRQLSISSTNSSIPLPQFCASDLSTRLELYVRTITRVRTLGRECVVAAEPPRALRARANALIMSFVATVGCVRSMGPSLTRLLQCLTKELLAEDVLGVDLCNTIRREYSMCFFARNRFFYMDFL